jgi:isopenicillin N synthase-like dioxygenase
VRNAGARDRLSFPLFYDPDFSAVMTPAAAPAGRTAHERWDKIDPNAFSGRYGDYLLRKVGAVFPDLKAASRF